MNIDPRVMWSSGAVNPEGDYVLYWMQQAQRVRDNHALTMAIRLARKLKKPLIVCFGLTDAYPEANVRHYQFMVEGLCEVASDLNQLGIDFVIKKGAPDAVACAFAPASAALVMDMGYMRIQRLWRRNVANFLKAEGIMGIAIESDVVVPVKKASDKEELAARTIRKKIMTQMPAYLDPPETENVQVQLAGGQAEKFAPDFETLYASRHAGSAFEPLDVDNLMAQLTLDDSVEKSPFYKGGASASEAALEVFLERRLEHYLDRNHPEWNYMSELSPYLHFGQIGVTHVVSQAMRRSKNAEALASFIDELVVRRELAINFVYYNDGYDRFEGMTYPWAYASMSAHADDDYPFVYDLEAIEFSRTHDAYFNSAMTEMRLTGKMHTYMRMYWAKKILEWVKPHQKAYEMTVYLNNKYFIDGRDPNSYAGIAWCYGKHDHPWKEREIFGKIRYMNAKGLERKFDMGAYVNRIAALQIK